MLFRRLTAAVAVTLTAVCLLVSTPVPSSASVDLAQLRSQAEQARKKLQRGTRAWEQGKRELEAARQRVERMRRQVEKADARLERMSKPLTKIVRYTYQNPQVTSMTTLVTSRNPTATMKSLSDLRYVTQRRVGMVREAVRLKQQRQRLVRAARQLQARAKAKERQLAAQKQALKRESEKAVNKLVEGLHELGLSASSSGRLPIGCDASQAGQARNYPNGLIPDSALCALPQQGERLRADAAVAFYKLNAAYIERFGKALCVTDSYRSLANQQALYVRKPPGLAAVPGTSNHGKGISVDLCGGIQRFGTVQYNWMKANAGKYGWGHPSWAEPGGSSPEPWHWNYVGS